MDSTVTGEFPSSRTRRIPWGLVVLVLALCVYGYFLPRWADWNANSRFDLVLAVVDRGTLSIDAYYQNTGDYAFYKGHYYSDKAPGTSFLGIPIYWVYKATLAQPLSSAIVPRLASNPALVATLNAAGTGLLADKIDFFLALSFVTFFVVVVPSALLVLVFYRFLGAFSTSEPHKLILTFAFAFATPAFAYSNVLYGHQIVALCLFASFYLLFRARQDARWLRLLALGFLLGFALITEYTTALVAAGLVVYALYQVRHPRRWIWLVLGGTVPLLLAAAYNYSIFGTPLPVGYKYSVLWHEVHDVGFLSIGAPTAEAIWGITFSSYRGLFFLSPFLLLAVPGFYFWWRQKKFRVEFLVALWAVVSFFLFNGSSVMWSGGFGIGPRYLVPVLPFLALPIIFFLDAVRARWAVWLAGLLMLVSFLMVWLQTLGGQSFPQYQLNPLLEYSIPNWLAGNITRNLGMALGLRGVSSLLGLIFLVAAFAAALVLWRYAPLIENRKRTAWKSRPPKLEVQ